MNYESDEKVNSRIEILKELFNDLVFESESLRLDKIWEEYKSTWVPRNLYSELDTIINSANSEYETKRSKILEYSSKCMAAFQKLGPALTAVYQEHLDPNKPNFLKAYNAVNAHFSKSAVNELSSIYLF
jgi:hypothetical protein